MIDRRQQLLGLRARHRNLLVQLIAADELAQELRVLLREVAIGAHNACCTWEDVGGALGVSRAAAHERFSPGHTRASRRTRRAR